ncbi:hypothetical protein [[Haemophilus] ducreyi]|uniref:hypothetical protein n=1 Tax=Haemophilus ducreyi TaxID=730 RepID=UPI0007CDBBCD|nr:hypothetical protein [[Haemophilus] ducreyi]ANF68473.1 hypothetical protein A6042_00020 [[Haemophilus] ducreyi]
MTGGYIENKGNPDELNVKGNITTNELKDEHHKDGGSFGGSFGVSETGVTQVNVNGGRVEQKHYEATQHSSISGINTKGKTVGNFKTDRSQSTEVHRDDTIAATNFNFELGDIAELAKKGKEKWDNRSAKTADNDAGVDSPRLIKGEAEKAQTLGLTKAGGNDVIPEIQLLTQKARLQSLVDDSLILNSGINSPTSKIEFRATCCRNSYKLEREYYLMLMRALMQNHIAY